MTNHTGHASPFAIGDSELTSLMGSELECPKCFTVAINRDFCACGEYLNWDVEPAPTAVLATEPAEYRPPAAADPRDATLLTLRDPARLDDPSAAVAVSVLPGTEVTVLATIRNQGEIVDTFDVRVDGVPDTWWTISQPTVFLNPWGTAGEYQQEVQVRLHPPRTPESEARAWPLTVVAHSRSLGDDVAQAPATLTVQPFQSTAMSVGPERRQGRRHARFDIAVANHGNSPMEIVIDARDTERTCPISVAAGHTTVPVGQSMATIVLIGVPRPLLFGRPIDHHLDVTHRATGLESEPVPQRVTFQQRPWMPWWVPPSLALLAAFITVVLMIRHHPEAPNLTGRSVTNAAKLLKKHDLKIGRTTYEPAAKGTVPYSIIAQVPEAGAEVVRDSVDITLAAPAKRGLVPSVNGRTVADATAALTAAHFGNSPQPSSAGDDWVVIRQDPAPGSTQPLGTPVTLAVKDPAAAATPTPAVTIPPVTTGASMPPSTPTPTPATPAPAMSAPAPSAAAKAAPKPKLTAKATSLPSLPTDLVFAGASSGRLYRWASSDAKAASLTAPDYRLETPTKTDDGYVAVQVQDAGRRLVWIAADGKTVDPIADGGYYRPTYFPGRGLLAVIAADGQGDAPDAGNLCVMDPHDTRTPACAPALADGRRVGRPAWAPNGRSVLALAAGPDGDYNELLSYVPNGADPTQWAAPASAYRAASIQSAVWVGNDRVAVLLADHAGAPTHLRLLARRPDGSFKRVKDFPTLTGSELAATDHYLALQRGNGGAMVLLDVDRAHPRLRRLTTGVNPAWAG